VNRLENRANLLTLYSTVDAARTCRRPDPNVGGDNWEFIIHRQYIETFCQTLMGNSDIYAESMLGSRSTHILDLHCPPGYGQDLFAKELRVTQTLVLAQYRKILRGFEDVSLRGASAGWVDKSYVATLKDIQSTNEKTPAAYVRDLVSEIRGLEKEGFDILSQTGNLEAADACWVRARGMCHNARVCFAYAPNMAPSYLAGTSIESNVRKWTRLMEVHGEKCIFPVVECWYRLNLIRLEQALRLIQRGGHLARRNGQEPNLAGWRIFTMRTYRELRNVRTGVFYLRAGVWMPQAADEVRFCCTVASIIQHLDDARNANEANVCMWRAAELAPQDPSVNEMATRTGAWIGLLLSQGRIRVVSD
jgi:hypothetical protein